MDKADIVHIYNGILFNHRKEQNCAICKDVDGSRDHHTEWSKSEKQMHINAYMCNLEKWYRLSLLQSRNRDRDTENRYMNTKGEGRGGMSWEIGFDIYTLLILCIK